jgi:hypothetical protein
VFTKEERILRTIGDENRCNSVLLKVSPRIVKGKSFIFRCNSFRDARDFLFGVESFVRTANGFLSRNARSEGILAPHRWIGYHFVSFS